MSRKLFVAGSPQLVASLGEHIGSLCGYEPRAFDVARDLTIEPDARHAAAALLDVDFCDALAVARSLRAQGFMGPIVMIGAASDDADASLTRPFRFADLAASLAAGPRSGRASADFGVRLTEKEAAILARLAQACGAVISKETLLADVWGYGPNVTTRTLETHIHRLRRKIEKTPSRPRKLLTEDGGYRLANTRE
jgi:hypothetical protein